jgi:hypothetical protein
MRGVGAEGEEVYMSNAWMMMSLYKMLDEFNLIRAAL